MSFKIDKKEKGILKELLQNSRMPLTELAKRAGISREVTTYHFNKLINNGVIHDFVTNMDLDALGYVGAAVFVNITAARQQEFEEYVTSATHVSWVAELSGRWNFGLSIFGKNNAEVDALFHDLYKLFKDDIIDHQFAMHLRTSFFYEKYIGLAVETHIPPPKNDHTLDTTDRAILRELSHDSRKDASAIARKLQVSVPTVIRHIENLERSGIISGYSVFLNVRKLGLYQHSVFAINKNVDEKEAMIAFLTAHPAVSFIAEYVGDPFIEFGIFTDDPYTLREHLQDIEQRFPDYRTIDTLLFQREFVSSGAPLCLFE